mgnify:CR=1 FL=1|jgi:hypothetical protein
MDRLTKQAIMEDFIDRVKELGYLIIAGIGSALMPVQDILILLSLGFVFNIFTGIVTDIHVNKARFDIKKAFNAITQLTFWATLVVFLDYGSRRMGEPQMGITAVKWVTMIVIYFYLTNIFKNARQVYPRSQAISFVYELLSTEIFSRLKNIVGFKKNDDDQG